MISNFGWLLSVEFYSIMYFIENLSKVSCKLMLQLIIL